PHRGPSQLVHLDRSGNSDRPSNSDRSGNWRQKSTTTTASPAPFKPLSDSDKKSLMKHKGCFRCRKTFVDHTWRNCDQGEKTTATVGNSGLNKEVKQEVNFISETEAEYQFEDPDHYQVVPPIILPIQLDDQITTKGL